VYVLADHGHSFPQLLLLLLQRRGDRGLLHISSIGIWRRTAPEASIKMVFSYACMVLQRIVVPAVLVLG